MVAIVNEMVGYSGEVVWDASKPDGQPTRCLDVTRARELIGFESRVRLEEGLEKTVGWFREQSGAGEHALGTDAERSLGLR